MDVKMHSTQANVLTHGQRQSQGQRLALTPRMRQSLSLLQMSSIELEQYIQQKALENPVVDLDALVDEDSASDSEEDATETYSSSEGDKYAAAARPWTLRDELMQQVVALDLDDGLEREVVTLVNSLDDRGYIPEDAVFGGAANGIGYRTVSSAAHILRSLEPAGVGACSLRDCLNLQLERLDGVPEVCFDVVARSLDLVADGRIRRIAARHGVTRGIAEKCCELIRTLNPIPSRGFASPEQSVYIRPEAVIRPTVTGALAIERSVDWTRKIRVATEYTDATRHFDEQTAAYVCAWVKETESLISDVVHRDSTVMAVMAMIVKYQPEALFEGRAALVPLTMEQVAAELGVNVSTVSRAVQDKWVLAPCGMVPLRMFFSKSSFAQDGGTSTRAISSGAIKARIGELVASENSSKPLSDQAMCDELVSEGVAISRRTVAKYRQEMDIPGASVRRRAAS